MRDVVLQVDAGDRDQLDRATTALYDDLRALGDVRVRRGEDAGGPGAKSGVGGSIAELVLSGGTVTAVYRVIVAWLARSKARSVTWVDGDRKVELNALSAADQRRVIEQLTQHRGALPQSAEDASDR